MISKRILPLLIILTGMMTLLNSTAFGGASLIAYFSYSILAGLMGVIVFTKMVLSKNGQTVYQPSYIIVFLLLAAYVFIHGLIINNVGLTHFYWVSSAIFLVSVHCAANFLNRNEKETKSQAQYRNKVPIIVFSGIALLALIESIVVFLQLIGVMSVPSSFFPCTGTWGNPNVTAMFLSMSLCAVFYLKTVAASKWTRAVILGTLAIILFGIILLQCRSAYLATMVFIIAEYGGSIKDYLRKNLKPNLTGLAISIALLTCVIILVSVITSKRPSTDSRMRILNNSIQLIMEKPIVGYGFGQFEKEYNLYAVKQKNSVNDHIYMAYNDFVELGIEGGIIATGLWIGFLSLLGLHFYKKNHIGFNMVAVLIAFTIIQLTNFGFDAIPAFVLFLIYAGMANSLGKEQKDIMGGNEKIISRTVYGFALGVGGLIVSVALFYKAMILTGAFYKNGVIGKIKAGIRKEHAYKELEKKLNGYALFHENYGDAFLDTKKYSEALVQYKLAMVNSSKPDILAKNGYSFQMLGKYDSAEYYYTTIAQMQPHKYNPQFALLRLYQTKNDTARVFTKAKEILTMPVKVRSKKVSEIKAYAKKVLDTFLVKHTVTKPSINNNNNPQKSNDD